MIGQIHHTRLRLNCSALKYTLFWKNIILDPSCECGEIETVDHYLLECNRYCEQRLTLINSLTHNLTSSLLLYGDPNLDEEANKHIFLCAQNYIVQTKRFTD